MQQKIVVIGIRMGQIRYCIHIWSVLINFMSDILNSEEAARCNCASVCRY